MRIHAKALTRLILAGATAVCVAAVAVAPASAASVLFDLGHSPDGSLYTGIDDDGRHWNVINTWSAGQRVANAVNSDGDDSFVEWHTTQAFGFYIANGTTQSTIYPATATQNGLQLTSATSTAQVRLAGLVPGNSYDLTFYGSREQDRVAMTYTIANPAGDGSAASVSQTQVNSWNVDDTVTLAGIVAQSNGDIIIDLSVPDANDPNTGFAFNQGVWSVLQIDGTFIPEPASLSLIAIGSLALLRRSRTTRLA